MATANIPDPDSYPARSEQDINPLPQLYLLTNDDEFELLYHKLSLALATGVVALLQIRRKQLLAQPNGRQQLLDESRQIVALAKRHQVAVLMNDDIELAETLNIGVHLGQGDGSVREARQRLGVQAIIGRTCHQQPELVQQAKADGASYAAMGAVFASSTKPGASRVSQQQLLDGSLQGIDLCLIGGIGLEKVTELKEMLQGAAVDYIAVVGDIMNQPTSAIAARCEAWRQVLQRWYD